MKHFLLVALLFGLAACGNEEHKVVMPEQTGAIQENATDTANASSASNSVQTSGFSGTSGTSGSSGSSEPSDRASDRTKYVVQEGDTLAGIASAHNVSFHDLARWNKIDNADLIYASQELRLKAP